MKQINLILGCHAHQPVGNFEFVFKEAYEKSYRPFIEVLERYPAVKTTLHYTGPLLDWMLAERPEFISRLRALVEENRIEIMGGAYYEPLLCAIPHRDAVAQIRRMGDFCETHFGSRPKGMWLAERVWEPQMARTLKEAGVHYTALDDTHFLCSGLPPESMFGYFTTEDEGSSISVFPILEKLRYLIPFHQVHESIDFLRENATEDGLHCAVIHDDSEKFGVWPGTYHSVYEEGWLESFFAALTEHREWLHCVTYSEYMAKAQSQGLTYITCASYKEMMGWALPAAMQRRLDSVRQELSHDPEREQRFSQFIRGGYWRNFLAKYPESNNIQKRMLRVSRRLERLGGAGAPEAALSEARKLLHQGQCNCAYWHGVFGGLYLNHLRTAIYEKLIAADVAMDQAEGDSGTAGFLEDFDGDGKPEVVIENGRFALFFSPHDGGTLFELDYKPKCFNILNTLTRREEVYHDALREGRVVVEGEGGGAGSIHDMAIAKEHGLEKLLVYDPYRRVALRDHFLDGAVTVEDLWAGTHAEHGDFATGAYEADVEADGVTFERIGVVDGTPVRIRKRVRLDAGASALEIQYHIQNEGDVTVESLFGMEFAANFLSGSADDRYYHSEDADLGRPALGVRGVDEGLRHVAMRDEWMRMDLALRFAVPARVYRFAIETVSQSEAGQERVYQGSVMVPCWPVRLEPGARETIELTVEITEL